VRAAEFLGARPDPDQAWRLAVGRQHHGAFGGAFGGLLAAGCVVAARSAAPGRAPVSLDCRFLRAVAAGEIRFVPVVLHAGRSLACVSVDVFDEEGRLASRGTVSLVSPDALEHRDHAGAAGRGEPPPAWATGRVWAHPPGGAAPIIDTLEPRAVARDERGVATALRVPWDEPGRGAEAACLAGDMCVGPPVAGAFPGDPKPAPNPDLSLRFVGEAVGSEVVGYGRLERMAAGVAAVRIEVWSAAKLLAIGVSCSLLVPPR